MSLASLSGGRQRPNVTCSNPGTGVSYKDAASALLNGDQSGITVFNSSSFEDPGHQQPGNTPRHIENLSSQGIANVDIGLRKQFSLWENAKLQVRMEAFNAFNRTRFDRAGVGWSGGSFGQVNALAQGFRPRQLQIVARVEF
jgi:hypothetical protein